MQMNQQKKYISQFLPRLVSDTNDMSTTSFNVNSDTTTSYNNNNNNNINRDEQCPKVTLNINERIAMKTTNVDDRRENQSGREKGERETREDDVKRTPTMREQERERIPQTKKNIDLVTSFTSEQYDCPNVNDSMTNLVSSSFNSNNNHQNSSLTTNRSRCSSSNSYPTYSMNHNFRTYEPSYSSIPRYSTSSSPYRKTHYLDASDEEVIKEEILEITNLNHYPTLLERWGDDTKTIVREEGEFKIEDYVEFEEIEPTIMEEIFYEIIYSNGQIKSTREIHRTRSQSRNFRKIKKRRIKRKRTPPLSNEIYNLSDKLNSVIQIGDRISTTNDDSSGDNHEITTTENIITKQTNENIPSNINGDRYPNTDIIGKDTSLQFSKSDEQKKDLYDRIKEKTNGFHPSCFISTQDDHEIISIEKSSINEEQTKISESQLHSTMSKVDQGIKHSSDGDQQTFFSHPIINSEELDSTKNTEKQELTDALVELTREIRAISLITHVPSTENTKEPTHFWKQEIEESSMDFPMKNEKEKMTFINKTIPDKNERVSFEALTEAVQEILATSSLTTQEESMPDNISMQIQRPDLQMIVSTSIIADEEDTSSVKRRLSSEDKSNETEVEQHPSSNALTDTFRKILSTLPPLYLPSTDRTMETTTQLDQINTKDDELLESTMNSTSIEDQHLPSNASTEAHRPLSEIKTEITESVEQEVEKLSIDSLVEIIQQIKAVPSISKTEENTIQITVPFGSPATIHLPSAEIDTETRSTEEETYALSTTNLSAVVDKQPETISTQSMTRIPPEQELNFNDKETAITIDGQSSLIARTDEDKNVELSSDFLPDIIRQIKTTTSSIYRPLVQHNKQAIEKSNNDILTEITEQISLTSIPLTNIEDNNLVKKSNKTFPSSALVQETIFEDKKNENNATHLSSNVLAEAIRGVSIIPIANNRIETSVDIKSSSDCVIENVPQAFQSVLHINESKSSATNSNSQSSPESSIQDNVLHRSELLSPSIVTDSSSSIITNEQLHDESKTFPLSTEINPINQTAPEPFYSISEPINIMNTILNLSTQKIPENNTNILQELETREQTSSSNLSIAQTSTASDTDFGNFYQHHNLPTTIVEQTLSNFHSIDTEQSIEKKDIPDLTQTHYELHEQRHIQSSFDDQQIEQKQITTDVHDHVEYLNLKSFPLISNLPSRKYRPVFGMPDELDNTFDDSTYYIDQTFPSKISDEVKLNISDSFEESQLIETVKNDPGIRPLDEKEILHEPDRTDTLIDPLLDLPSPSLITQDKTVPSKNENLAANGTDMDEQSIRLQHERFNPKEDISAATAHFQLANIHPSQQEETLIHNTITILKESLNDLIENIRLNIGTNEEDTVINAPAHQPISEQTNEQNDSSSLISYTTPVVTGVTFDIASNRQLPTTNELIKISSDAAVIDDTDIQSQLSTNIHQFTCSAESIKANDEVLASNVTDNEILVSGPFEQLLTKLEDDQQQQPLSTGLLQIMNHLTPSTLRSKMSADIHSQSIQSIEKAPSKADTVKKLVDENDSPNVITTLTSVLSKTLSIVQNVSSASADLNTDTNRQTEISGTSLQSSTTINKQHQDDVIARPILNVKETISNLVSSDQTTTSLEFSLDLPEKSFNQNLTEVVDNTNENITSTQEQQTQTRKQTIFGIYNWSSSPYKVAATESQHLCSTHQSSADDHQELQVISDDYPWYSDYYSIVDAEAKIAQLQQQLNITIDQPPLPQEHELENDEHGFHVVQRRKRIPSSTRHGKTLSSTIVTTEPTLSPDIDLEPIILHGHPSASIIIPLSVPQTASASSKNQPKKKKKKDKKEMILFDAPEPILSDMNKQEIDTVQPQRKEEEMHPANDEMTDSSVIDLSLQSVVINEIKTNISDSLPVQQPRETSEDHHSIVSSDEKEILNQHTSSISSTVELEFRYSLLCDRLDTLIQPLADLPTSSKRQKEKEDHYMCDNVNRLNDVANENQTKNASHTDEQSVGLKYEKLNDREEIPDATSQLQSVAAKGTPLLNIIQFSDELISSVSLDQSNIGSNINASQQEETSIHGKISSFKESLQHLIENIQLNTGIITNEEIKISSDADVSDDKDLQSHFSTDIHQFTCSAESSTANDEVLASNVTDNEVPVSGSSEELSTKADEDKQQQSSSIDIFKNINNLLPSKSQTTTILESSLNLPDESFNHTQHSKDLHDDKPQQTFNQSLKEVIDNTNENITSTQQQQTRIRKQPIFGNYPWYSSQYKVAATESERLFSTHQSSTDDHKQEEEVEPKVSDQELQVISDDYPWYSDYYSIVDAEAKIAQLQKPLNITIDQSPLPQKHELENDDEDGFHVVHRRKHIPSSTTHEKTVSSTIVRTQLTLSPDIDLEPIILHGHPGASTIIPSNVTQTSDIISKKKHKKKKKDKKQTILFDAPEPTISDINTLDIGTVQSENLGEKHGVNNEMTSSSVIHQAMQSTVPDEVEPYIPSKDSRSIVSSYEKEILNQHTSNITSTAELESQYSLLCDRFDTQIKPLAGLTSSPFITKNQSKASNPKEEEYEHHICDHVNILDDVANENHTVNTIDATEQSNQFAHEELNHRTPVLLDQTNIESNIESSQQEETSIHNKISSFKESLQHLIENIRLNIGKSEEADAINTPAYEQIIEQTSEQNDSSSAMDYTIPVVTDIASNITNNLPLTTTHKGMSIPSDAVVIDDKDVQSQLPSNVIDYQVLVSGPSEVLSTKLEDDQQQQPLSTGLFQIMHNLLPSTLRSKMSTEDIVEKLVDENESSNVITKLTFVLNGALPNVQNVSSASTTSNTETDQEAEISTTSLQSSAIHGEQHHSVFDAVARAIANVKDTILEFSLDLPDESCNHTQQSNDLDNEERQQTVDQTLTEVADNKNENITSTQEQQTQIRKKPIFGNYPWYSSQYKVTATESERLFSTDQPSTDDHQQEEDMEPKVSDQELQVISDDYPWYSVHYSIVDAEAKIAQLQKPLNITIDQSPLPQKHELENDDEDGFHVVQRRKRIPSSTTQEKTLPSTIVTTEPSLSPDKDLEPIILHGHPGASIIISSNVPETISISSKNKPKKKKKKKDKKETILFDAPEPTLSDMNKQEVDTVQACRLEEENKKSQENDGRIHSSLIDQIVKHEVEDLHPISTVIYNEQKSEILSTSIILNTEELTAIDDNNNESTPADDSHLRNSSAPPFPEDIEVNSEAVEYQATVDDSILPSSPISRNTTTNIVCTKMIALPKEEEEEDNEGFQLVCHHKRIRSAIRSEKASPSSNTTSKQILTSNIKMETPTTTSAVSEITGSEKKRNRHKKHKKESKSLSSNDWTKTEQQPTDQQTVFQSSVPSSINEDSREQSTTTLLPILNAMKIDTKTSTSDKEEEKGEDNEGFQVVRYRKRIKSAPRSEKAQVSSSAKITYRQNLSRDMALKPTVIHGRQASAPRSISHTTVVTETPSNKNKQARLKQQKKQTSLISTPPRLPSTETHINTSTDAGDTFKTEPSVSPTEQSIKQTVKEYHMSTENHIKTTDQQSSIDEITTATTSSLINTDIGKSTLIEHGDDDEFQVVCHHKHTLSSTDTDAKHDSSTSITIPKTVLSQTATSKKNSKKPKQNKKQPLPSLTTDINSIPLSIDRNEGDNVQAISESEIVAENNSSSKSDEVPSLCTTHEIVTSQINASLQQIDHTQRPMQSIKSIVNDEVSTPSNELPCQVDHFSIPEPVRSISLSQPPSIDNLSTSNQIEKTTTETSPTTSIEPPAHIEDEQIKTTSNKKSTKRRKTKPHTKEKPDDENVLTSSKHFIHTNTESNLRRSDDEKQASDRTTTHYSYPSTCLPSQPTHLIQVKYPYEEINSKLDLFLPEYIREQLNTSQTSSSSRTPSIDSPNLTPITTSSNIIQKKKQRPKMLTKDHEAKSLLTNEFDNTINSEKELNQTIILTDDENVHDDDDEFIIQTFNSHKTEEELTNISIQETFDNVLSRGFYLWLQASQALSQQNDTSSSFNSDLTNAIQSIVIQPTETDDDEDSWEAYHASKSTYMIGVQSEKRIHITHAYLINHPETISIPSWLIVRSNDNTFQDDSEKFDSDDEEYSITDPSKKRNSIQTNTQLLTMKNRQSNSNNDNHSIHFDDWAHFLEHKNSYYIKNDLSTFYTRPFDDDTLISEATPIYDSIKHKRQRYGDFLLSNNDIMTPETTIKFPVYKSKPSEYFQNYRKQEITSIQYDNDDEIVISHSNNGLSRQMKP